MSEQNVALIHRVGRGQCAVSGKETEGVLVTIAGSPIKKQFLSWRKLREVIKLFGTTTTDEEDRNVPIPTR